MDEILACYEKNNRRLKLEFWLYCFLPFIGFFYNAVVGLFMLIFLSPIWAIFLWGSLKQLRRADHKILLTRQHIKVDEFSSEMIPWGEIKKFRLVDLPSRYRTPVLIADFLDNSKYQKSMGRLNSKAHSLLYKNGVVLDVLTHYKESPENIVRELNLQLRRNIRRSASS